MKIKRILLNKWYSWLEAMIFRLARPDALLHLSFFGLITGFLAGGVIVLFRLLVEHTQDYFLPGTGSENYEQMSPLYHFLFPVIASVLLAILFYKWSKGLRVLGVARIMERVAYHQGYLTLRGFILQFVGAAIAIVGGHSVGREGPHAHLGASISSLFGQLLKLPNNSIRTLVASGAAAGIAASFNTPLAGVIFALEVIMMEYALNSFIPVMLAAVVATALSNAVLGGAPAFIMPELSVIPLSQLPIVLLLGVIVGACAALFNHLLMLISSKTQSFDIWWRILAAGIIVGLLAMITPEVLGIGYDTVNAGLAGKLAITSLLVLAFMKILATSVSVGLGVPGGMIGPAFFIGTSLGGAVGIISMHLLGDANSEVSYVSSYALLGMGAMMGASLQAPLAALIAIVELSYSPGIILSGMLVIVVAQLTASEVFNKKSLFVTILRSNGLDYSLNPVVQVLRAVGVASVLDKSFERHASVISREQAEKLIHTRSNWLIVNNEAGEIVHLMPVSELAKYLSMERDEKMDEVSEEVNLMEIPAKRHSLSAISLQANLMQAHEKFSNGAESL
ncbi:MAG: chloride channel protein, partial [Thiotrichaceae bacterium]